MENFDHESKQKFDFSQSGCSFRFFPLFISHKVIGQPEETLRRFAVSYATMITARETNKEQRQQKRRDGRRAPIKQTHTTTARSRRDDVRRTQLRG